MTMNDNIELQFQTFKVSLAVIQAGTIIDFLLCLLNILEINLCYCTATTKKPVQINLIKNTHNG